VAVVKQAGEEAIMIILGIFLCGAAIAVFAIAICKDGAMHDAEIERLLSERNEFEDS
jgi:hypothetical protein